MRKPASENAWIPCLAALWAIAAGLARPLDAAVRAAGLPEPYAQVRLLGGPDLASSLYGFSAPGGPGGSPAEASPSPHDTTGTSATAGFAASPDAQRPCLQPDTLLRRRCLDSLARASGPRALREIEAARDTTAAGGRDRTGEAAAARNRGAILVTEADREAEAETDADDIQERRNQGYLSQFFLDVGRGGGWDWDLDEWAVVLYVVIGVIVVGAFLLWGIKALYDLAVNKDDSPVFKEAALQFSYSGRTLHDPDGAELFRDAWLMGGRFAFGVEKPVVSFGLALEGGAIDLSVRALESNREIVDVRGGYLVGGPLIRFGRYRPLAFTLEFLNGTSTHSSIGWISKSRMTLAAKARGGLTYGAHLGAVFYDLRYSDGLVYRRGDFNRDLSVLFGVDAGWSF